MLERFVAFFEKNAGYRISHGQYILAKAIFDTNEGKQWFGGGGRGLGKTTLFKVLEAFAHLLEAERGPGVASAPRNPHILNEELERRWLKEEEEKRRVEESKKAEPDKK